MKIFDDMFINFDTVTNVTDTHTQTQTPHDGIGRAYAQHRAAKTKTRAEIGNSAKAKI